MPISTRTSRTTPTLSFFESEERVPEMMRTDIQAFNFFDAAYPSAENVQNWGHLQPETIEDITDPDSLRQLSIQSLCEVLNDDALNGMISVGAESLIGSGCRIQIQCGLQYGKYTDLEQYIEYLWEEWFNDVRYAQKLRTAQKDLMQFGSYYRRIVENPHKKMGLDVVLISPLRISTPYNINEGDYITLDGERFRVYNGIAFDQYRNERYYCVTERPYMTAGYYDNAVFEWVSSKVMCHVFDPQFSEQITGYPMTAPSLEKGVMRRQYEKEELRAARLGATLTGTFETTADFKAYFDHLTPAEQRAFYQQYLGNAGERAAMPVDNFINLPPLTSAKPFDTKHPHSGFASHRAESLKGQGRSLRMPENIATGSSANYNYASVQKDTQHWNNHRQCFRQDVELIDLRQSFDTFLMIAAVKDSMLDPIFRQTIKPVIPTFYWKEEEHADPVKQVNAWKTLLSMGVMSLSDIMMQMGKDPEKQKQIVKKDLTEMKGFVVIDNGITLPVQEEEKEEVVYE